jgi:glutamine amidotransferase-like uncharacterized protein
MIHPSSRKIVPLVAAALLFLNLSSCGEETSGGPPADSEAFDVALYQDVGVWSSSVTAAERMFQWMGYRVKRVDADAVNRLGLEPYKVFCVPGGDMYEYSRSLTSQGKQRIRTFIQGGGGYIGICGGAYLAAGQVIWRGTQLVMDPLRLYQGRAMGPVDAIVPYPDSGMCRIQMRTRDHPVTATLPDSAWVLYYWGPELLPDPLAPVTILGEYAADRAPAILAFDYGLGRVFLIGTHPEIEEDSDRDGVTFGDELDDRGSDWDLMKNATDWCAGRLTR